MVKRKKGGRRKVIIAPRKEREITAFTARCEGDCVIIIITTILIQLFVLAHPSWRPHNASDTTQPITSPIPLHSHSCVAS